MRIMENLKIAVLAVRPSQAIDRNCFFALWRAALSVRTHRLAVLAVHPEPLEWTGKADTGLHVLCVRRRVRVSSMEVIRKLLVVLETTFGRRAYIWLSSKLIPYSNPGIGCSVRAQPDELLH